MFYGTSRLARRRVLPAIRLTLGRLCFNALAFDNHRMHRATGKGRTRHYDISRRKTDELHRASKSLDRENHLARRQRRTEKDLSLAEAIYTMKTPPLWLSLALSTLMATAYFMILTATIHVYDQDITLTELMR